MPLDHALWQPFDFHGSDIRVIKIDGEPWFVTGDVLRVFNYSRPDNMLRSLDERDKMVTPQSLRGMGLRERDRPLRSSRQQPKARRPCLPQVGPRQLQLWRPRATARGKAINAKWHRHQDLAPALRKETALRTYTLPFRLFHLTLVASSSAPWLPPKASIVVP